MVVAPLKVHLAAVGPSEAVVPPLGQFCIAWKSSKKLSLEPVPSAFTTIL